MPESPDPGLVSHARVLQARMSVAVPLARGQAIRIVNTHGTQVVDTWALAASDPVEAMSMPHTRAVLQRVSPREGDMLYSDRRRPLLRLERDTSPGRHDTLIAACDPERYQQLGVAGHHASCAENFASALVAAGLTARALPAPLNLFMNIPWTLEGDLAFEPPLSRPGDFVVLRALEDVVVVLSACPQDIVPINGAARQPMDVSYEILPEPLA